MCCWYLVGRGQGCCEKVYSVMAAPSVNNYPAPNINNAEMEKFCSRTLNGTKIYSERGLK